MAARVLLQRRSVAPLAALALGGVALAPATVLAEAPTEKRKPIYDDINVPSPNRHPPAVSQLKPTPSPQPAEDEAAARPRGPTPTDRLAVQIGRARMLLYRCAATAEDKVNGAMDSAFHLEQSFTSTVASLAPPRESGEKLMPGAIYVLVAAMAGSIVARNRNVLLRAAVPLALGFGAGWLVLPLTMRNVADLAWQYEQRAPALAEAHLKLRDGIQRSISFARVHGELGVRYVDEKVTDARETVEGWVKQGK
ncbi:hypothetical protein CDD83_9470 [Cordyceps sp. RAO-2017]|nr:hypothetical protein CDD83_9470 [Cordyceps sp. RAO-2017]